MNDKLNGMQKIVNFCVISHKIARYTNDRFGVHK